MSYLEACCYVCSIGVRCGLSVSAKGVGWVFGDVFGVRGKLEGVLLGVAKSSRVKRKGSWMMGWVSLLVSWAMTRTRCIGLARFTSLRITTMLAPHRQLITSVWVFLIKIKKFYDFLGFDYGSF